MPFALVVLKLVPQPVPSKAKLPLKTPFAKLSTTKAFELSASSAASSPSRYNLIN
jgi:hypothetical protein